MDRSDKNSENAATLEVPSKDVPAEQRENPAEAFLQNHQAEWGGYTPKEASRVLWKIDRRLIPLMMITTILAAIDVG